MCAKKVNNKSQQRALTALKNAENRMKKEYRRLQAIEDKFLQEENKFLEELELEDAKKRQLRGDKKHPFNPNSTNARMFYEIPLVFYKNDALKRQQEEEAWFTDLQLSSEIDPYHESDLKEYQQMNLEMGVYLLEENDY